MRISSALRAAGIDAEVINAGVEGYSTDQELLRMEHLVPLYRPDMVLLEICDNDFGANQSRRAYGMSKPSFVLGEDGALKEIPPEPNDHVTTHHSGVGAWLRHSALYRLIRPRLTILRAKLGGWEERNMLGIAPDFYYSPDSLKEVDWKLLSALLLRMRKCCTSADARFLTYAHPSAFEVWNQSIKRAIRDQGLDPASYDRHALEKRLQEVARATGVEFCPLISHFELHQDRGPFHLLPKDPHCNGVGYEMTAEVLSGQLRRMTYARAKEGNRSTSLGDAK